VISWPLPQLPVVPGTGLPIRLYDTATGQTRPTAPGPVAGLYVCGITPYDATHLGHAATYLAYDLLGRAWHDGGHHVHYVQNVTDVDDPLLERALATGVDWRDLAADQIALFREDMTALGIIPPQEYLGAVETIPLVVDAVSRLLEKGAAYRVQAGGHGPDVYFAVAADPRFGGVSNLDRPSMLQLFGERGGDPQTPGKQDALDPVLWRAARDGEPSWDGGVLGHGRPGWHIECTAIALTHLDRPFDVNGGGSDLIFPHHEMGASHAHVLTGSWPYARCYSHAGMVGLDGEKMSKSKGNLVLVSALRAQGVEPMVIRLALLAHHYRSDWSWQDEDLVLAQRRFDVWHKAFARDGGPAAEPAVAELREKMADDLNAPAALAVVDRWAHEALTRGGSHVSGPGVISRAANAILGVRF